MDAALLPVKRLDDAKRRLGAHFSAAERRTIAYALMEDALALAVAAHELRWWVVTGDRRVRETAEGLGLSTVREPGGGLNAALRAGVEAVEAAGATTVTIVPSDIPLTTATDLIDVIDTGATSDAVVVPSRRDGGTNILYMRPATLLEPRFGPHSLEAHVRAADERGLRCSVLPRDRVSLDIDTLEDIDDLLEESGGEGGKTVRALAELRRALK